MCSFKETMMIKNWSIKSILLMTVLLTFFSPLYGRGVGGEAPLYTLKSCLE